MFFNWFYLYLCLILFHKSSKGSVYNVAVIEYGPNLNKNLTPKEKLEINVENYVKIIEETAKKTNGTLDLIIFPESTLMYQDTFFETAAQIPSFDQILCNTSDKNIATFLNKFSCEAVEYKTTIIINFTEKITCHREENLTDCIDGEDFVFYNTNVALGSNGRILARYRKWNLFGERGKSRPKTLDLPVIEIQNTTFGMMTCFDIQFGIPAFNLTRQKGVKNVIFPLNWISELPYLSALQVQQMWAQEFNVILLAAGSSVPDAGAGGSGIFFGNQGALANDILAKHGTKIILNTVSTDLENQSDVNVNDDTDEHIDALASAMDAFYMLVDPYITDHNSIVLNTTEQNKKTRLCHGDEGNELCCDFNISITIDQNTISKGSEYYSYHLVVFNGVRTYSGLYYGGVETCGLIACLNSSLTSCGQRFKNYSNTVWPITFNSITVAGYFKLSDERVQFATTLLSSIRPLSLHNTVWEKETVNSTVTRTLTLKRSQSRLLTFGIFGRDFKRDWDPVDRNGTSDTSRCIDMNLIFSLVLSLYVFSRFCNE